MSQPQLQFDLAVIGGGPGGYAAAIRATQRGLSVALIEKHGAQQLGGTCLNVGCIPTKYLLDSAKTWHKLQKISKRGFKATKLSFDWQTILAGKNQLIARQRQGLRYLMNKHHVTVFAGHGSFHSSCSSADPHQTGYTIVVNSQNSAAPTTLITARYVILATGSQIKPLQILSQHQSTHIYNSDEILNIAAVPQHLAVIGGGVIGMEFASLFAMMGSQITIIEAQDNLLNEFDQQCVQELLKYWKSFKLKVHTATTLDKITPSSNTNATTSTLHLKTQHSQTTITADAVLVAVGRTPATTGLGLEHLAIKTQASGAIGVDQFGQTTAPGVYAIGDITPSPALAHTATAEAHLVVDHLSRPNQPPQPINYLNNPLAVYSYPELAAVGFTAAQLNQRNIPYSTAQVPFQIMAKATIEGYPEGFIKIHSHPSTTEILGVHIVGGRATELISEFVTARALETTLEEFAHAIRPHPTLSEILSEVAAQGLGEPVHAP